MCLIIQMIFSSDYYSYRILQKIIIIIICLYRYILNHHRENKRWVISVIPMDTSTPGRMMVVEKVLSVKRTRSGLSS